VIPLQAEPPGHGGDNKQAGRYRGLAGWIAHGFPCLP
jgi:hypothetical protein